MEEASRGRRVAEIDVKMGSYSISNHQNSALTTFVGSCIALCMYEPAAKVGGLAHIMLPSSEGRYMPADGHEAKYADHALKVVVEGMKQKGARVDLLISKLIGGAKTFTNENSAADLFNIGERNYLSIKSLLTQYNIPVLAEDIGSTQGRWVKLDVSTGQVTVRNKTSEVIL